MRWLSILCCLLAWCTTAVRAADVFPIGTFVYVGLARNYDGKALTASDGVEIQAVNAAGDVLARSLVTDTTKDGINYRLQIPMATASSSLSAVTGEKLSCVVLWDTNIYVSVGLAQLPPVGHAMDATNCNLIVAHDSDGDGVPDEYVESIQGWLDAEHGGVYDAHADYDGDGFDNYAEYVAGTDPFNPDDLLRIVRVATAATSPEQGDLFAVSFDYVGGRVYGMKRSTNLTQNVWSPSVFRRSVSAGTETVFTPPIDDDFGTATLYLEPAFINEFFRVEVK